MLLVLAFLVGFAGNSFTAGIAWNSAWQPRRHQGFALGVFGAGDVGASVTKLIGPQLIAGTAGRRDLPRLRRGGWRLVPVVYAALLLVLAAATWFLSPPGPHAWAGRSHPARPGRTRADGPFCVRLPRPFRAAGDPARVRPPNPGLLRAAVSETAPVTKDPGRPAQRPCRTSWIAPNLRICLALSRT